MKNRYLHGHCRCALHLNHNLVHRRSPAPGVLKLILPFRAASDLAELRDHLGRIHCHHPSCCKSLLSTDCARQRFPLIRTIVVCSVESISSPNKLIFLQICHARPSTITTGPAILYHGFHHPGQKVTRCGCCVIVHVHLPLLHSSDELSGLGAAPRTCKTCSCFDVYIEPHPG